MVGEYGLSIYTSEMLDENSSATIRSKEEMSPASMDCDITNEIILVEDNVPMWISRAVPRGKSSSYLPSHANTVALVLPGVPGLIGFYHDFMKGLHESSQGRLHVVGLSYPGQYNVESLPWKKEDEAKLVSNTSPQQYSLREQSEFVLWIMQNRFTPGTRFVIIGHSAGAFISLEMLQQFKNYDRVEKVVLLFPVVEEILTYPAGRTIIANLVYYKSIVAYAAVVAGFLPDVLKTYISKLMSWKYKNIGTFSIAFSALLTYEGISNFPHMAEELCTIKELQHSDVIENYLDKITFYYGPDDHYAPETAYEKMKKRFPKGDIRLCQENHQHAFNMYTAREVSQMVWNWCDAALGR